MPLLGVRKKYQSSPLAMGVLSLVVAELLKLSRQYGDVMVEFSWILETNRPMNAIAELAAGPPAPGGLASRLGAIASPSGPPPRFPP